MRQAYPHHLALVASVAVTASMAVASPEWTAIGDRLPTMRQRFLASHPGAGIATGPGAVRVFGPALAVGPDAQSSAARFCRDAMPMFGVPNDQLRPEGPATGLMYDRDAQSYRFTLLRYQQHRDGVAVEGGRLLVLVRNEPGYPVVLANPDVRPVGGFRPDPGMLAAGGAPVGLAAARQRFPDARIEQTTVKRIWAGSLDEPAGPRLVDELIVRSDRGKWRLLVDARSGAIVDEHSLIHYETVTGTAAGLATEGLSSSPCQDEVPMPLPYLEVHAGGKVVHTDVTGNFTIDVPGPDPLRLTAALRGRWFEVFDASGPVAEESMRIAPPGPASLQFNLDNTEAVLAQVNGYIEANRARDFVLEHHPDYPGMDIPAFAVNVNQIIFPCPGNAWYDSDAISINFCLPGFGSPNTAYASIIHHELAHHLVETAGSGQGPYGEGMADTIAVLLADDPRIGMGFLGECDVPHRNAQNDCLYAPYSCSSCGFVSHLCGQVLSGSFWDTRLALQSTDPDDALQITTDLAINSILLHTGSAVDPTIAIDVMTLDDDNGVILDGTPHYDQILQGFGAHDMTPPTLALVAFAFPDGLPDLIAPLGGTVLRVNVYGVTAEPAPNAATLYIEVPGSNPIEIPMTPVGDDGYVVEFPPLACGQNVRYALGAETIMGDTQFWPIDLDPEPQPFPSLLPVAWFDAFAVSGVELITADDFEQDLGWIVSGDAGVGHWERGVPAGDADRGDPGTDADGSGACYLTGNDAGDSDVDGGTTILTSPMLDGSAGEPAVAYWRWFTNDFGGTPSEDVLIVQASDDDGKTWVTLEQVGPTGAGTSGGWVHRVMALWSVGLEPTDDLRVRFIAADLNAGSVVEAAVDGVRILDLECDQFSSCPADCAAGGDGRVDVLDLAQLLGQWGQFIAPCDANRDGIVGVADLLEMLGAWGACR
jgi:hypothetical protein